MTRLDDRDEDEDDVERERRREEEDELDRLRRCDATRAAAAAAARGAAGCDGVGSRLNFFLAAAAIVFTTCCGVSWPANRSAMAPSSAWPIAASRRCRGRAARTASFERNSAPS